jgi:hypothetical protein
MREHPRKETHYNQEVWVNPTVEALRESECLCLDCKSFKPNQPDNCPTAQSLYEICEEKGGMALIITRCPGWK